MWIAIGIVVVVGFLILVFLAVRGRLAQTPNTEKASVSVQPGQYFEARGTNVLLIYGECLECMAPNIIYAKCYSRMCPTGEAGPFRVDQIIKVIDKSEFESAIRLLR